LFLESERVSMDISFEKGISKNNALLLCKWSNKMGRGFQEQWMGAKVSYPLSYDKIKELENTFSIFTEGQFIGMIQKVRIDKDNIHIGRFVLEPEKTGSGLGTAALRKFMDFIFEDTDIKSISLSVFDFNQNAKRVYEKLGFEVAELIETPKLKYTMKKIR
jgi:acetyltransferase, GNAT family